MKLLPFITVGVLAVACGGKTVDYQLPDGGRVTFTRGAWCKTWDQNLYTQNWSNPPVCKTPIDSMGIAHPEQAPCCADCSKWEESFQLPLGLNIACGETGGPQGLTSCAIGYEYRSPVLECDPSKGDEADRYCLGLFSQLVLDPNVEIVAVCDRNFKKCASNAPACHCGEPDLGTKPPRLNLCVKRDGKYSCEPWCKPMP